MEGKTIGIIAIVIIIVAGGWYLLSGTPANAPTPTTTSTPTGNSFITTETPTTNTTTSTTTTSVTPTGVTIAYTNQGFSPKSVTIPLGTTVTFVNQATSTMWIASAPHPTHQSYDGTTRAQHCVAGYSGPAPFDACSAGTSFTFTFTKIGTWGYHNHGNPSATGTVIVTAATAI